METKKIFPVLIITFFIFGLVISGIIGYSLGLKKVRFVTEIPQILPKEIFMRAGEVTNIEGNIIYLKSGILTGEIDSNTGEVEIEILKISINSSTKFISNIPGPEDFNINKEAKFEDVKVGSQLYVLSLENIKNKKEFLVSEITILE
jgi:hypothetical protein